MKDPEAIARRLLGADYAALDPHSRNVARHVAGHSHIARHPDARDPVDSTRGQRAADAVARFGGSWTFIGLFMCVLLGWVLLNSWLLVAANRVFDPYPYILLNLFLSMLAAIQAPIILMSQNRQSEKDRANAGHDYEVNLKAELEIMLLHEKLDALRQGQWEELLALQKQQLALLSDLIAQQRPA